MEMIDLSQVSIIIPFYYDGEERLNNLRTVLRYFETFFRDYEILIIENGPSLKASRLQNNNVHHIKMPVQTNLPEGVWSKTRCLNFGAKQCQRHIMAFYDADVLFHPQAVEDTLSLLFSTEMVFVFPFNGLFWNIANPQKQAFISKFNFNLPTPESPKVGKSYDNFTCIHTHSPGGAAFFKRHHFLQAGGYNENFISWGWEDNEMITRFTKIGWGPVRIKHFACIHLDHPRGLTSSGEHHYFKRNYQEFKKIHCMTPLEVCDYIHTQLGGQLPTELLTQLKENQEHPLVSRLQKWWWSLQI